MQEQKTQKTQKRVAVVTGGGRGIGAAICARLARDGLYVMVADLDQANAQSIADAIMASGGSAAAVALDVTDRDAVRGIFNEIADGLGRIDVLVNNAMWIRYDPILEITEDSVDRMVDVGFKALIWTTQAAFPHMPKDGTGTVINMSSPASVRGVPGSAVYSAVKGAVSSFTRQASGELGRQGVRVNGIIPGAVPTEGARSVVDEDGYELRRKSNPLGRLGDAEDIAAAVSFLASKDASYVNGHLLAVEGGLLAS